MARETPWWLFASVLTLPMAGQVQPRPAMPLPQRAPSPTVYGVAQVALIWALPIN